MEGVDISVIIPVYNIELEVLSRCLESVKGIERFSHEVILVDDGSREEFKAAYRGLSVATEFVRFIGLDKNMGVSVARNTGIGAAKGRYLMFLDADDVIYPKTLRNVKELEHDMYIFDIRYINGENKWASDEEKYVPKGELNGREALKYFASTLAFHGAVAKLIRADILKKNHIKFDPAMVISEDAMFCYNVLKKCETCYHVREDIYAYHCDDDHIKERVLRDPEGRIKDKMRLFGVKFGIVDSLPNGSDKEERASMLYKRYVDELFDLAVILVESGENESIVKGLSEKLKMFGEYRIRNFSSNLKKLFLERRLWFAVKWFDRAVHSAKYLKNKL